MTDKKKLTPADKRHYIRYINWAKESELIKITIDEYNEKVERLRNLETSRKIDISVRGNRTRTSIWLNDDVYACNEEGDYFTLFVNENGNLKRYVTTSSTNKVETKWGGHRSFGYINDRFKELNDISMRVAFGIVSKDFVNYAQAPLVYCNEFAKGTYTGCCKSDVSSAYPYQASKMLPDSHSAVTIDHYAGPNEEYPFAFYPDTNHIAIYNELDTRTFCNHELMLETKNVSTYNKVEDTKTILMKASSYSLADIMQELYDGRKENPEYKQIMNSFIGYMRSVKYNKGNFMAHISSVVYARHNKRMCELYDSIVKNRGKILFVLTDCIAWVGNQISESVKEKKLGNFVNEFENVKIKLRGKVGQYMIFDKDEIYAVKTQGVHVDFATIKDENDFDKIFNNEQLRYILDNNTGIIKTTIIYDI